MLHCILRKIKKLQRMKRHYLLLLLSIYQLRVKRPNTKRSFDWWDNIVCKTFSDQDYYENFRVSRKIFNFLCDQLKSKLTTKENKLSGITKKISVQKKVAISLYYLASCCEYRIVGNQFGVHKSTVCKILHQFVEAVLEILTVKFITMPNKEEAIVISTHFNKLSHIPNIIGIIDRSHIPILPPAEGYRDFINRKSWASIVLQAIVDHKYRFRDISVKNPGSTHDAVVLKCSDFYGNWKTLIPTSNVQLDEHELPFVIVGDPSYPLLPWLLKGYTGNLDAEEDSFNAYLNSSRVYVENAFGRLKARWRILLKRSDVDYKFGPKLVATCCTLHNVIETLGGKFNQDWLKVVEEAEVTFPQPSLHHQASGDIDGYQLREILKHHLVSNYALRQSILR